MSIINWPNVTKDMMELLLNGSFCMLAVEATLGEGTGKAKRILKWLLIIGIMEIILSSSTIGIDVLTAHALSVEPNLWEEETTYIFFNTFAMLLNTLLPFTAGMWIYRQAKSVRAFTAVLLGLGVSVIFEYFYAIAQMPFLGPDAGRGFHEEPPIWLAAILLFVCLLLGYLLYTKKFLAPFKQIIDTPDGRMHGFVKVPVLSSVVFVALMATLRTFGIDTLSIYWEDVLRFIVVFACLIFVYAMMYWAIFRGVMLSTEAMKNRAELGVATHIQANMLPCIFPAFPERQEFDIYATMTPAKEVGGDFYDFFMVDDDHLAMVIADVSGKGVPAALFMVITKTLLKNCAQTGLSPSKVLEKVNNQLCENNEAEMFVTVWLGILTISTGCLTCANAGHEYPVIQHTDGDYELMKDKHGFVLAGMEDSRYREYEWKLDPGDSLYVYTDGVAEATDKDDTLFGTDRMLKSLNGHKEATPAELLPLIKSDIDAFVGDAPQFDDITMLNLRYKGAEART